MIINYAAPRLRGVQKVLFLEINYTAPHLRGGCKKFQFLMIINYAAPRLEVHKVSILDDF